MTKAYVIQAFDGVPDGNVLPRRFEVGEELGGDLAAVALREGWAAEHPLDHDGNGKAGGSRAKADGGDDLSRHTVAELKEIADAEGVALAADAKKADIVEAILSARAAAAT